MPSGFLASMQRGSLHVGISVPRLDVLTDSYMSSKIFDARDLESMAFSPHIVVSGNCATEQSKISMFPAKR